MAEKIQKISPQLVNEVFEEASNQRLKFEKRWYLVDNFYEGKHFVNSLSSTGELVKQRFPKGVDVAPIPRLKKQMETMLNLLFTNNPRWVVYPFELTEDKDKKYYEKVARAFQILWTVLQLKSHLRSAAFYALKHNVGYLEVGMDDKQRLFVDHYDTYNIYHEPNIESLDETHYLIKVVSKTINELENSEIYDQDVVKELSPEYKYSISEYKHIREQEKFGQEKGIGDKRLQKVLIKEFWLKDGDKWILTTECQGKLLREPQVIDYSLPFVDIKLGEGEIYQTSIFEDLIPLNKKIDVAVAYLEKYIKTSPQGVLLVPEGTSVERILNKSGEIITYKGVTPPQYLQPNPLNPAVMGYEELLRSFMDERAISVMAFGKLPPGVKAWRALEALKNIEFANLQTAIENLNKGIERLGYKLLEIISHGATEPIPLVYEEKGELKQMKLINEQAYQTNANYQKDEDIVPIVSKYRLKVEVEQGTAYTEEGKRETALELARLGKIDDKTLLEMLHFSNVGDIVEAAEKQKEREAQLGILNQLVQQKLKGQQSAGGEISKTPTETQTFNQ